MVEQLEHSLSQLYNETIYVGVLTQEGYVPGLPQFKMHRKK